MLHEDFDPQFGDVGLFGGLAAGIGTGILTHYGFTNIDAATGTVTPELAKIGIAAIFGGISWLGTTLATAEMNVAPSLRSENKKIRTAEYIGAGTIGTVCAGLAGLGMYIGLESVHRTPDLLNAFTALGLSGFQAVGMTKAAHVNIMQFRKNVTNIF